MIVARSWLFNIAFIAWSGAICFVGLPLVLLIPYYAMFWYGRIWAGVSLWLLRVCCNITHRIEGEDCITPGPVIYASKHQSAWDTLVYWVVLGQPAYVLKKELLWLPLFGIYLAYYRNIPVDRSGGSNALKTMLASAKRAMFAGRPIVIYPEGTRTAPGAKAPYHPGVAALYNQLKIPVVPVALNSGLFWRRNAMLKTPGVITLRFLPPIEPGLRSKEFLERLETTIEAACESL